MANKITASEIEQRIKEAERLMGPLNTEKMARALMELHDYKLDPFAGSSPRHLKGMYGPQGVTGSIGMQGGNPAPQAILEVRDVERLAKAGVTISFEQIKDRIKPDSDPKSPFARSDMILPLYERWAKSCPERDMNMMICPWGGAAFRVGDKVQVMICTQGARAVLLEDDYALYPSDALLASLIMMLKTETPGQ